MSKVLFSGLKLPCDQIDVKSMILQPYKNRINLYGIYDIAYIDLNGPDVKPDRRHVFYVQHPENWKESDIDDLFSSICTLSKPIMRLGQNTTIVALSNPSKAEEVHSTFIDARPVGGIFVTPYDERRGEETTVDRQPVKKRRQEEAFEVKIEEKDEEEEDDVEDGEWEEEDGEIDSELEVKEEDVEEDQEECEDDDDEDDEVENEDAMKQIEQDTSQDQVENRGLHPELLCVASTGKFGKKYPSHLGMYKKTELKHQKLPTWEHTGRGLFIWADGQHWYISSRVGYMEYVRSDYNYGTSMVGPTGVKKWVYMAKKNIVCWKSDGSFTVTASKASGCLEQSRKRSAAEEKVERVKKVKVLKNEAVEEGELSDTSDAPDEQPVTKKKKNAKNGKMFEEPTDW